MNYVVAFLASFLLDVIWARYTLSVTEHRRWNAGVYAVFIILFGGITTIIYVADPFALIATAAGAFCGTVIAIPKK